MPKDYTTIFSPLGKIRLTVLPNDKTPKWKRLKALQLVLKPMATREIKPRHKGIYNCAKWSRVDDYGYHHPVKIEGYGDGRVIVRGVKTCGSVDCPNCGDLIRVEKANDISMAVQGCLLGGGEVRLVTTTKAPEIDDELSIKQVKDYVARLVKMMKNYNYNNSTKIGLHLVIEPSFSRKIMGRHHRQTGVYKKRYLHVHTHSLVLFGKEDTKHENAIKCKMKELWKTVISEGQGHCFLNDANTRLHHRAFRWDVIEGDKGLGNYLNKTLTSVENIGLETEMGQSKGDKVKGRGLFVVIDDIIREDSHESSWGVKEDKRLVRAWFNGMFRARRTRTNKAFDAFKMDFIAIREQNIRELAEDWVARNQSFDWPFDVDITEFMIDTKLFVLQSGMDWKRHELRPKIKQEEEQPRWVETITGALWDSVVKEGYYGLLQELLKGYHLFGYYEKSYELLMKMNGPGIRKEIGYMSFIRDGLDGFIEQCYYDGVLIGTYPDRKTNNNQLQRCSR